MTVDLMAALEASLSGRPRRIQLRRTRAWRKPAGAIVVARPTKWGNPYRIGDVIQSQAGGAFQLQSAELAVVFYRAWLTAPLHEYRGRTTQQGRELLDEARIELAGHDLACWCALDQPCHADVLLELANG